MIVHLLKHLGWLLFYGAIWTFFFSIELEDERTVFQTGYEYMKEKKYKKNFDNIYDKSLK